MIEGNPYQELYDLAYNGEDFKVTNELYGRCHKSIFAYCNQLYSGYSEGKEKAEDLSVKVIMKLVKQARNDKTKNKEAMKIKYWTLIKKIIYHAFLDDIKLTQKKSPKHQVDLEGPLGSSLIDENEGNWFRQYDVLLEQEEIKQSISNFLGEHHYQVYELWWRPPYNTIKKLQTILSRSRSSIDRSNQYIKRNLSGFLYTLFKES